MYRTPGSDGKLFKIEYENVIKKDFASGKHLL